MKDFMAMFVAELKNINEVYPAYLHICDCKQRSLAILKANYKFTHNSY